ncbi:hypothetical protein OAN96_01030 [Candidatus Gracilibacteria bacterium]|nr:hypothetical protein [Candidatus Gracilibacteria bacterium]
MKKIFYTLLCSTALMYSSVFADTGVLGGAGITKEKIRRGDLHLTDIGPILKHAIDWIMGFAGTIAVIAIIIGAYKILFGSVSEGDTKKGKEYVAGALIGFGIAALAWFFVKLIIDNFS